MLNRAVKALSGMTVKRTILTPHSTFSRSFARKANPHLREYTDDEAMEAFREHGGYEDKYTHMTNQEFEQMSPTEQTNYWKSKMLHSVRNHYNKEEFSDEPEFDDEFYETARFPEDVVMAPLHAKSNQVPQHNPQASRVDQNKKTSTPSTAQSQSKKNEKTGKTAAETAKQNKVAQDKADAAAGEIDFSTIFSKSKLNRVFSTPPAKVTIFSRMQDRKPMYFSGTRRVITPDGFLNESSQVYLARSVDRTANMMTDHMVTFDYETEAPFEQEVITHVQPSTGQAHVVDMDEATGKVRSRTFIQLRGEPWAWHSAAVLSNLEYSESSLTGSLPVTVSRIRFDENSLVNERIITQDGQTQFILIDEMSEVTETQFNTKIVKMFDDYQKQMAKEMQEDASTFADYEKKNGRMEDTDDEPNMPAGLGMGMSRNRRGPPATKKGGRRD